MTVLTQELLRITKSMLDNFTRSAKAINSGNCDLWAEKVRLRFPHLVEVWVTDWHTNECGHIFIRIDQKWYDAERPEGVDHHLALPIFKRFKMKESLIYKQVSKEPHAQTGNHLSLQHLQRRVRDRSHSRTVRA